MKKKEYPRTIGEHFDEKYGKPGTDQRTAFEERAEAYMIAEMVKDARKQAHMTQKELADKLSTKRSYISRVENASGDIRLSTLRKIVEEGLGGKLRISIDL